MGYFSSDNLALLLIIVLWVLPWKGYSLWIAARNRHKIWFVLLLVLNTFSILEIIYVFAVAKKNWEDISDTIKRLLRFSTKK